MTIHQTTLHVALADHLAQSGESMRALSLRAGLSAKAASDILHRPGLRPSRGTLSALSGALGVELPAPEAAAPQTYAALIARLERADDPSGARWRAAAKLRWFLRAAGWIAETKAIDRGEAIRFFAAHRPASFGLSKGSYATYKSAVLSAIDEGSHRSRARDVRDIDGPYAEIQARVRASTALPADLKHSGGPLFTYLHDEGIAPDRITAAVLEGYSRHRLATGPKTEAACVKHVKRAVALLARLPALPDFAPFAIAAPPHPFGDGRRRYGAAEADAAIAPLLAEFDARVAPWSRGEVSRTGLDRAAFIAELDRQAPPAEGKKALLHKCSAGWQAGQQKQQRDAALEGRGFLLADEWWSEATLAVRRGYVASAALALRADSGFVVESLEELTDPEIVHSVAAALAEANAGEHPSGYVESLLMAIRKIARDLVGRPAEDIEAIGRIVDERRCAHRGAAPRNRAKLLAFTPERMEAFVDLSASILLDVQAEEARRRRARRGADRRRPLAEVYDAEMARQVMLALAHDILLARAPRSANVIRARLEWVRWHGERATLVVPAHEIKMRKPGDPDLPIPLGPEPSALMRTYIERIRPRALRPGDEDNPFLFPGQDQDGAAAPGQPYGNLLRRLCEEVHRRVGAPLHPHLYRHLIGWDWLRRDPDRLPDVQIILGHRSLQTTLDYYASLDEDLALDRWQEHLNDTQRPREERPRARGRGPAR